MCTWYYLLDKGNQIRVLKETQKEEILLWLDSTSLVVENVKIFCSECRNAKRRIIICHFAPKQKFPNKNKYFVVRGNWCFLFFFTIKFMNKKFVWLNTYIVYWNYFYNFFDEFIKLLYTFWDICVYVLLNKSFWR